MAFNIAVSGSTGFIGKRLCQELKKSGIKVWPLVREKSRSAQDIFYDCDENYIELEKLAHCQAVINLVGKNVADGIWTYRTKKEIYDSRIKTTKLLAKSLARLRHGPEVLLNASAIGFYGERADQKLDESMHAGHDFLALLCRDWEDSTEPAKAAGIRVVNMRFGHVVDPQGGFLKKQLPFFKLGLALGFSDQYLSWVTLDELIAQIIFLLDKKDISGPVNMVSLAPITSLDFAESLSKVLHKKIIAKMPKPVLSFLGDQGKMLTTSTRAYPKKLLDAGFEFSHKSIDQVLREQLKSQ